MRTGPALWLTILAMTPCDIAPAEAGRETTVFLVGAFVPSPSCIASITRGGIPDVSCSGAVSFLVRTSSATPDVLQVTVTY